MISRIFRNYSVITGIVICLSALPAAAEPSEKKFVKSDKVSSEPVVLRMGTGRSEVDQSERQSEQQSQQDTHDANDAHQRDTSEVEWVLHAEQWELARSGDSILSLPPLNKLINHWLKDKSKKIEIQYPGGEEGEFWVQELGDWLVSLGIPSSQMFLLVGSSADDVITFRLNKSDSLIY